MSKPVNQNDITERLEALQTARRIPRATYRVQFNADFRFCDAIEIVPYLHALGISHMYASPLLQARPGSTHGYDIVDYSRLNDALGTDEDFEALVSALHAHGMGLIVDIVPNHMGIGPANAWWMDVLENGPSSEWAPVYDISWQPVKRELVNKVLLPVFEDQYGAVLESGEIKLAYAGGQFFVDYRSMILPATPDSYPIILENARSRLDEAQDEVLLELDSILTAIRNLPVYTATAHEQAAERKREKEIIKRRLAALTEEKPAVRQAIEAAMESLSGRRDDPTSFDQLDELLSMQPYRLASFRVAGDEINYRRFFNINDMAAIHIERADVFDAVHARIVRMIADGHIDGLRVDHPDGLWHPAGYFRRLQALYLQARLGDGGGEPLDPAIAAWLDGDALSASDPPFYVVVEKILSEAEPLPQDWLVHGTTGYDFLNLANGLLVDRSNADRMTAIYNRFIGREIDYAALIYDSKIATMTESLASEIGALGHQLDQITELSRKYRDFTLNGLTNAIREVIASLSIYRTYIIDADTVTDRDRDFLLRAILDARRRHPITLRSLFTFLRDTLMLRNLDDFKPDDRQRVVDFVMKFQQMTGPVMAKSVEDTAFYVYNRLISLNEVGGHPDQFGISPDHFHEQNRARNSGWPHAMLASSTHDTKRSEDVRARINVLSEIPDAWEAAVFRWGEMNHGKKTLVDDAPAPDKNDEYLYYQTLIGVWDETNGTADGSLRERLVAYMQKALNEAKVHTNWVDPNDEYVSAVVSFIDATLADPAFMESFGELQRQTAYFGRLNALAQTLLKLTSPGVPDVYQGTELWDLSLVDPDNRRPVDYEKRRQALAQITQHRETGQPSIAPHDDADGRAKLFTIAATLNLRRDYDSVFAAGTYEPLAVEGDRSAHVLAFARRHDKATVIVAVPRLVVGLLHGEQQAPYGDAVWGSDVLRLTPDVAGEFRNVFTGEALDGSGGALPLGKLFCSFPVALLINTVDT